MGFNPFSILTPGIGIAQNPSNPMNYLPAPFNLLGGTKDEPQPLPTTMDPAQLQTQMDQIRANQNADLASGAARGQQLFANGSLGRISEGYSPQEMNSYRSNNLNASNQALAGGMRTLATTQGANGVHGALATAQSAKMLSDANQKNAENENTLFANNIAAKTDAQKYNQSQGAAERMGQLTTEMGYGSLGAGERAGTTAAMYGQLGANAAANSANKSGSGGLCCFIFLESRYGNGTMDKVVRRFRDENMTERNRRGYYKLSEVFVPLMRKSKLFKWLVGATMTGPMVAYGKAYYKEGNRMGILFSPITRGWIRLFNYLGGDHSFIRENGEVV